MSTARNLLLPQRVASATAAWLLATSIVMAQDPAAPSPALPVTLFDAASPIAEAIRPDGSSGGLWAAGRNYKVSFHDGMVYYPHVGTALPHQPVRWRTTSVRVGGRELLPGGAAPAAKWQQFRCEYDLGPVVERYDVRAEGVEQSFVFAQKPGAGEIVITGELATPLRLQPAAAWHGGLQLTLADGTPMVGYGAATAIDARGAELPVQSSASGATITLRLDAASADAASYPLVVDPLFTNTNLESGGVVTDVDVLHETLTPANSGARTWVVYSRVAAAGDEDLWVKRLGTNFTGTPIETFREITSWDSKEGRIALCPATAQTVTVFTMVTPAPNSLSIITVHKHDVTDIVLRTSMYAPFGTTSGALGYDSRPAIGGRLDSAGDKVYVVWQRDFGSAPGNTATSAVYGSVYDPGLPTASTQLRLLSNSSHDQERPSITREADGGTWLAAFQTHDGTVNDDWDIEVIEVLDNNITRTTGFETAQAGNIARHKIAPQIAGTDGRYLLTYSLRQFEIPNPKPQSSRGEDVYAQRIDRDHANLTLSLPYAEVLLDHDASAVLAAGGLAHDWRSTCHWCATVHDEGADTYGVFKLGFRGAVVETATIGPNPGFRIAPGGVAFNGSQRNFPLVYGGNNGSANGNRLQGAVMGYEQVAPAAIFGASCGSGVWAAVPAMHDRQQIGAEDLQFLLFNAPNNSSFAFLVLSANSANHPLASLGMPGCTGYVDVTSGYVGAAFLPVSAVGHALFSLDLIESLGPMNLFAQWIYDVNGTSFQASEGLRVELGR